MYIAWPNFLSRTSSIFLKLLELVGIYFYEMASAAKAHSKLSQILTTHDVEKYREFSMLLLVRLT